MSSEVFTQLVDAHYLPLYRFALSLAKNSADAGDLVQQTFFIWATKGHGLREMTKAKSWLFTTLYREFLRGRRRDARATSIEDLTPAEADVAAEEVDRVARMDAASVVVALQSVDDVFRAPLTLFYLEDLSY
ncbi:MAG: RNA polymerase sigma factor, partial [Opitutus sp.]